MQARRRRSVCRRAFQTRYARRAATRYVRGGWARHGDAPVAFAGTARPLPEEQAHPRLELRPFQEHLREHRAPRLRERVVLPRVRRIGVLDPPPANLAFLLQSVQERVDGSAGEIEAARHLDALEQVDAVRLVAIEHCEDGELRGALAELGLPCGQVHGLRSVRAQYKSSCIARYFAPAVAAISAGGSGPELRDAACAARAAPEARL